MPRPRPPRKPQRTTQGNPIARAYALKALMEVSVTMKIQLYMSKPGENVEQAATALLRCFYMTLLAAEYDKVTEYVTIVDLAVQKLISIVDNGSLWDPIHMVHIDDGMDAVQLLMPKLSPKGVQAARLTMGM